MEDYLEIIVTAVILIITTTFSQIVKGSKKTSNTQPTDSKVDDLITSSNDIDTFTNSTSTFTFTTTSNSAMPGDYTGSNKKRKTAAPKVKTTAKSANNAPKTQSNGTDEDSFDLRKAVIYSEILNPKFKEEDF